MIGIQKFISRSLLVGFIAASMQMSAVQADSTTAPPSLSNGTLGKSLGEGQTWHDMTSSRFLNVTYTNTMGRAIQVVVIVGVESSGGTAYFYIDNVEIARIVNGSSRDFGASVPFIIPAGSTYSLSRWGGRTGIAFWSELF